MQQKKFELLQKLQQNPLPSNLLTFQSTPITQIPRPNYFPFSNKLNLKFSHSSVENDLFYYSQSFQNFSHFNFPKPQDPSLSNHFLSPSISIPHPIISRDSLSQQFFQVPASLHSEVEQKKVNFLDILFTNYHSQVISGRSPDISSEDVLQKKIKIEGAHTPSNQDCLKTEFKQENDAVYSTIQTKEEEEQQLTPLSQRDDHPTKPVRSPPRNKWKNIPGHIIFAIKRGCKRCKENPEGPQITSIKQKWDSLPQEHQSKFWTFIQKYNRCWKTWSSIIQFISQEADEETTQILVDLISELLSSKHKESFETWLSQTKISDETKQSIKLGKKVFREEFIERIRQTQKLSFYNE